MTYAYTDATKASKENNRISDELVDKKFNMYHVIPQTSSISIHNENQKHLQAIQASQEDDFTLNPNQLKKYYL